MFLVNFLTQEWQHSILESDGNVLNDAEETPEGSSRLIFAGKEMFCNCIVYHGQSCVR